EVRGPWLREGRTMVEKVEAFEDLDVFRRAYRLSLDVHRRGLKFPSLEQRALADQLRRGNKTIWAQISAGFGRQTRSAAEFKRFLGMAMGSADEMRVWLRYCLDLGYLDAGTWRRWRDEYQEISKMLQGLSRKWRPGK